MSSNNDSNVRSFAEARARRFIWRIAEGDLSMLWAGFICGRCYRFRRTSVWRDGDIAAVTTSEGKRYIGYVHRIEDGVKLAFANDLYPAQYFYRDNLTIEGVLDV